MRRSLLAYSMVLTLLTCSTLTAPELPPRAITDEMRAFWRMGQSDVSCMVSPWGSNDRIDAFKLHEHPDFFDCGGVTGTAGCFRPPEVHFTRGHVYVLRHEAAHAILWRHRHTCWRTIGHDKGCKPCS